MRGLKKFLSSDWAVAIFLFILAVVVRAIPQIKAGIWPIGYDTFNTYAAELSSYNGPLINFLKTANILYLFFLPFKAAGADPNWIIKIFGPIIYGGLIVSFYFFARRFLKFSILKSFLLVVLTTFQLAALRLSWDLYRNELALIFLFWGLIYLPKIGQVKNLILFSLFVALVTLSNQLVTVLLLVILLTFTGYYFYKKKWEELISIMIVLVVMAILFTIVISSSGQVLYDPHVFFTSEKNYFWRYFYQYDIDIPYKTLKEIIFALFWLLYGFLVPLAVFGLWSLRKNLTLWVITLFLIFGTFSSLIFSGSGLIVWERWLFMLVFPLAIYAVEGAFQIGKWFSNIKQWSSRFSGVALAVAIGFWTVYFGWFVYRAAPFLTADYQQAKPPLSNDELNSYFPRTMVHSSLGIWLIPNTVKAVEWLNEHAQPGSVILIDNRYRGIMLTHFDIDDRYIITNPWAETIQSSTLEAAKKTNYWPIYLIWNITRSVDGFDRIYNFGDRGIYQALPGFREQ